MRRALSVMLMVIATAAMPTLAYANIGLPMIALVLPPAWSLLVPIVFLEAAIGSLRFGIPFGRALKAQAVANTFSTVIGLPLAWSVLAILELSCCGTALGLQTPLHRIYAFTIQSPWLIPYEGEFWWMIPAASAVFVPLLCGVSIVLEYPIVTRLVGPEFAVNGWRWVVRANILSYLALVATTALAYRSSWVAGSLGATFMPICGVLIEGVSRVLGIATGPGR